ncbi:hypothetical protein D3C87_1796960 [compost metagenome]
MNVVENAAGIRNDGVGDRIDVADTVHALEREDDVGSVSTRRLATHKAGIAGLRHDGRAAFAGELQDGCNLLDSAGLEQQR